VQELRFVAVSEDGSYAVLAVPGRSGRYILPIDERLRAVAQGQTSRLAQYEIEVESPLRPKEIQARIRAGETAEEIADAAGIPVERVRWFEGPVLAERGYIADQAQAGSVRRAGDSSGPGPRLGEIVTARLNAAGTDPADGQWDSRKRGDGNWQVSLTFPSGGRLHVAEWVFDPRRRHVMPDDDNAARLSLPESELPPEPVSVPGEATVTPIASRLGAAAGMGGGAYASGPAVSRFRPDRSVLPDRSLGVDRSLADRPATPPAPSAPAAPAASSAPAAPAQERHAAAAPAQERHAAAAPGQERHAAAERPSAPAAPSRYAPPDRAGYQDHRADIGYAEFPESAPYRSPEPAPEPATRRDLAQEPAASRAATEPQGQQRVETAHGYDDPAAGPAAYHARAAEPGYREATAEPRAYPEPAAYDDPAATAPGGPVLEDPERGRPNPARPVVFEDPEPALRGEQLELGSAARHAPATEQASPVTATPPPTVTAGPVSAGQVTARPAPGPSAEPAAVATPEPEIARVQVPAVSAATTAQDVPAARPVSAPAASAPEPSAPAAAQAEPAEPTDPDDASSRPRAGAKKTVKGRRSSVPSWDEIMLGSSRQRD
jgi:hypothetical protein